MVQYSESTVCDDPPDEERNAGNRAEQDQEISLEIAAGHVDGKPKQTLHDEARYGSAHRSEEYCEQYGNHPGILTRGAVRRRQHD